MGSPDIIRWGDSQLSKVDPFAFETYYATGHVPKGLAKAIGNLAPNQIEVAMGYGSSFSGDARKGSRLDVMTVVRDPREFYEQVRGKGIHLGTISSPGFHAWWNDQKMNFYLGSFNLNGEEHDIKVGVIGHDQFLEHAKGGRPDTLESGVGKGHMWVAGRLQKANFVRILDTTDNEERADLDAAMNQARIDGVWLATSLSGERYRIETLGPTYTDLSYIADRRIEQAGKSVSLYEKNADAYAQMLGTILREFSQEGLVERDSRGVYHNQVILDPDLVREWLKKCKGEAWKTNVLKNTWTMGLLKGIGYEFAKVQKKIAQKREQR